MYSPCYATSDCGAFWRVLEASCGRSKQGDRGGGLLDSPTAYVVLIKNAGGYNHNCQQILKRLSQQDDFQKPYRLLVEMTTFILSILIATNIYELDMILLGHNIFLMKE